MDRMVASAIVLKGATEPGVYYTALNADGRPDSATSELIDFLEMASWNECVLQELLVLVRQAEAGEYRSPNAKLPDWGINDVNIWLALPKAEPGTFCITNENTNSEQHFRYRDFWAALSCYRKLQRRALEAGGASLVSSPIEELCVIRCIRASS